MAKPDDRLNDKEEWQNQTTGPMITRKRRSGPGRDRDFDLQAAFGRFAPSILPPRGISMVAEAKSVNSA
jgi:hypothetical protein